MDYVKKIGLGLAVVAAVLGFKFYNKSQAKTETRQQLERNCAQDADCLSAVSKHFESCFDDAYSMGGRRRSAKLDASGLVGCINGRSGKPYFTVDASGE